METIPSGSEPMGEAVPQKPQDPQAAPPPSKVEEAGKAALQKQAGASTPLADLDLDQLKGRVSPPPSQENPMTESQPAQTPNPSPREATRTFWPSVTPITRTAQAALPDPPQAWSLSSNMLDSAVVPDYDATDSVYIDPEDHPLPPKDTAEPVGQSVVIVEPESKPQEDEDVPWERIALLEAIWTKRNPESTDQVARKKWVDTRLSLEAKTERAVKKAAIVGRGFRDIEKIALPSGQKVTGKTLDPAYMIEAAHRYHPMADTLKAPLAQWQAACPTGEPHFLAWLEKARPDLNNPTVRVAYFTQNESDETYQVKVTSQGLTGLDGSPYSTEASTTFFGAVGAKIYVMDAKGTLLLADHKKSELHHSSLSGGGVVVGAGEIRTDKAGKILWLSNESGHYRPTEKNLKDTLRILQAKGIDLTDVKLSVRTPGGKKDYSSALQYLESDGTCQPSGWEGVEIGRDGEGRPTTVTLKLPLPTPDKQLALLRELASDGIDLTNVSLVAGAFSFPSSKTYLETNGQTLPNSIAGMQLTFDDKGSLTSLRLDQEMNQRALQTTLDQLKRCGVDLSTLALVKPVTPDLDLYLNAVNVANKWQMESCVTGWTDGEIQRSPGKVILIDRHTDPSPQRHKELLTALADSGFDLFSHELSLQYHKDGRLVTIQPQRYLQKLGG